ncbi:methyltransferase [Desulfosarcina alkanivorans]|jgi:ubiquinone/menaquinone biosynthesis C-methylase UbiE|uniref:Methyltransferase n=1 Tax=Desulfosarcina alkanivorans TaxID=571177 RepID=A0A5K7Z150_9BACT|nr:class I SAM-dependent methyltransferase [Desulfosarcina alkanivorans]BBO72214.1 methyltransferase [Desulfosarcina alkanivorans]
MSDLSYFMENDDETLRLEIKTDLDNVKRQALWAGLRPGMRVADLACGPGKTTQLFHDLVQPQGSAVGIDGSANRIAHAEKTHSPNGPAFFCRNLLEPLDDIAPFDFIWVRFFLEYHKTDAFQIVKNISRLLNPGGILCLVDLDYNCLSHYGIPERMQRTISRVIHVLENKEDFDPRVGIKLYSFLYDLGFENIDVMMEPHHLIFGELGAVDEFNWTTKVEVAVKKFQFLLDEYENGYDAFYDEFKKAFSNPRRFTYTPLISCRGRRPAGG